jgi:pimeloyl-ACP methyl ester carboxylesterase
VSVDSGPPLGRFVEVIGLRLFVHSEGAGAPAVVFLPGAGLSGLDYWRLQTDAGRSHLAITYDRAGTGWSERVKLPRTAAAVTDELNALLASLADGERVVLIGHSLGGLYAQLYATRFPSEVAGLVLLDPAHQDYDQFVPSELSENGSTGTFLSVINRVVDTALATAPTRAMLRLVPAVRKYQKLYRGLFAHEMADWPDDLRDALIEQHGRIEWLAVGLQEARTASLYDEVRGTTLPPDLPLIILASVGTDAFQDAVATETTRRLAAAEVEGRLNLYANLVAASNHAELRQIDAGHVTLPLRHPEAIIQAIHDCCD